MNDTRKPFWVHTNQSSSQAGGDADRELPHNILAERAVLGTVMSNNDFLDRVPTLRPEHFYDPLHQRLYMEIQARWELGELADALTLREWIEEDKDGKANGGIAYLNELLNETQPVHLVAYSNQIKLTWQRRFYIEECKRGIASAYDHEVPFDDLVKRHDDAVSRAMDGKHESHGVTLDTAMLSSVTMVREAMERGGAGGLPTGFPIFDRAVPLLPKRFIVLGGVSSMGKSAVAWKMAIHAARHLRDLRRAGAKDVGWVLGISPEMDAEALALRAICAEAEVPYDEALRGFSEEKRKIQRSLRREGDDWISRDGEIITEAAIEAQAEVAKLGKLKKLEVARAALADLPLHFVDVNPITPSGIAKRLNQLKREYKKIALIVVDYLQYIEPDRASNNGAFEMKDMVNKINAFKNKFDCPVLALSQVKEDIAKRDDRRPKMEDLSWTGQIKNNADGVVFVHREEYWLARDRPKKDDGDTDAEHFRAIRRWEDAMSRNRGLGQLLVRKSRDGTAPLDIELSWHGPTMCATEDPKQPWPWDQEDR
jgi:replicative DNA helicase